MNKIQQDVFIYKEKAFATAQNQFEKDLKKRQHEGWRLVSVTPTGKKGFGRIVQLTAIYEKDARDSNKISADEQYSVNTNGGKERTQVMDTKEKVGIWEKVKESNRRNIEKENAYQSTLNPKQLRRRKVRNLLISSIMLLIVLALCIGAVQAATYGSGTKAILNSDTTKQQTDTPIPTSTPIKLTTHQEIETYAGQILDNMSTIPYGNQAGIVYTKSTKELEVSYYISSSQVLDNNNLKNMIEINCFNIQQALWTSRLKGIVGSITIHIQSDLVDKYGNQSKGEVGTAKLISDTNRMIQWDNISFDSAWDKQIYDEQWMLPSVQNS